MTNTLQTNTFVGGMNLDTDVTMIPDNQYRYAENVRVITDTDGNAKFSNIPFATSGNITIYYKQITSDGGHTFDDTVKSIVMNEQNKIVEITNPEAPLRNFTLTDASFPNVVISDGQIILNDN